MFRAARIRSTPPSALAASSTMARAGAGGACPVTAAVAPTTAATTTAAAAALIRFDIVLPHLCRATREVIALGDVIGAELLDACDAAADHLLDLGARHRRHVHRHVALDVDLAMGDVVQPAVAPPLELLGSGRDIAFDHHLVLGN